MRGPVFALESTRQWRRVVEAGALSNAKRTKKKKRTSPRPARQQEEAEKEAAAAMPPPPPPGKKRVRATKYLKDKMADPPWPTTRLSPPHRIGQHGKGVRNVTCDFPCCSINAGKLVMPATPGSGQAAAVTPAQSIKSKAKKASAGSGPSMALSSGRASPACSEDSNASSSQVAACKFYCMDCYDPSDTRPMNFHADCWNQWHGLCDECPN